MTRFSPQFYQNKRDLKLSQTCSGRVNKYMHFKKFWSLFHNKNKTGFVQKLVKKKATLTTKYQFCWIMVSTRGLKVWSLRSVLFFWCFIITKQVQCQVVPFFVFFHCVLFYGLLHPLIYLHCMKLCLSMIYRTIQPSHYTILWIKILQHTPLK